MCCMGSIVEAFIMGENRYMRTDLTIQCLHIIRYENQPVFLLETAQLSVEGKSL